MKFKEVPKNESVIHYGTEGRTFYIIIKGLVSIQIPNQMQDLSADYSFKRREYMKLLEWKTNVWDPKVQKLREEHYKKCKEEIEEDSDDYEDFNISKIYTMTKYETQ